MFYRKPAVPVESASPDRVIPAPEPSPEPVAPSAPAPRPHAKRSAQSDAAMIATLREENARQRAQVLALEAALARAQAELNMLQAKLQAILTVPQPEDTDKTRVYRVREGDTLYTIAQRPEIYGDSRLWKRLLEANRHQLADPALLQPGQQLIIPR